MTENRDLKNVIAGMAALGEIYLRIEGRIQALYEENPALLFEARSLMAKAGYIPQTGNMIELVDRLLSGESALEIARTERIFLKHYADMFYDPILTQETVKEYLSKDEAGRAAMKERMIEQLSVFPDRHLGQKDLVRFGYTGRDLFPVGMPIAEELMKTTKLTVFGIHPGGRKEVLADLRMLESHRGMYAVRREDWTGYYLSTMREGREIRFTFREEGKEIRIYQIREDIEDRRDISFMPYDVVSSIGIRICVSIYDLVYESTIREGATLDDIFEIFNIDRPADFKGHSLSVSDVIAVREEGEWVSYYVDSFGFRKIPDFLIPDKEREERISGLGQAEEKTILKKQVRTEAPDRKDLQEPIQKSKRTR